MTPGVGGAAERVGGGCGGSVVPETVDVVHQTVFDGAAFCLSGEVRHVKGERIYGLVV